MNKTKSATPSGCVCSGLSLTGGRGLAARAIATYLLDPFDPDGVHIKKRSTHG